MWYLLVIVSRNQTEFQYGLLEPPGGNASSLSPAYIVSDSSHWWLLFLQVVRCACSLARASAGSNSPASIAMIAITTSNSISVNARRWSFFVRSKSIVREGQIWERNRFLESLKY